MNTTGLSLRHFVATMLGLLVIQATLFTPHLLAQQPSTFTVRNGDFEQGHSHWYFSATNKAKATATVDKRVAHDGKMSIRLTNQTPKTPNVFGTFYQTIHNLKPMTAYQLTFWCKANDVKHAWVGGGEKWEIRKQLPEGTYDWKQLTFDFATGINQRDFTLRFNVDGMTDSLWIDTLDIKAVGLGKFSLTKPQISHDIPSNLAFYPAFKAQTTNSPTVHLRDATDPRFGADIQATWDEKGLNLTLGVLDPTRDAIKDGIGMWASDSIQLGLETQLDQAQASYGTTSMELGITVDAHNQLHQYAWHPTSALAGSVLPGKGRMHDQGYDITVTIPWSLMNLPHGKQPDILGLNVVVNDGNNGSRRCIAWTEGITKTKNPARFAIVRLMDQHQTHAHALVFNDGSNLSLDVKKDLVSGHIIKYTARKSSPVKAQLTAWMSQSNVRKIIAPVHLPSLEAGQCTAIAFALPASQMPGLGSGQLNLNDIQPHQNLAQTLPLTVNDFDNHLKSQFETLTRKIKQLNDTIAAHPELAKDAQLNLGRHIAERFSQRVAQNKQSISWSLLQLDESITVLDQTLERLAFLQQHSDKLFTINVPTGTITHRDGLLWSEVQDRQQPVFLYGYGHFSQVVKDLPHMNTLGATIIQRERGPRDADAQGNLNANAMSIIKTLDTAQQNRVKLELLLSPHYFPGWPAEQAPDVMIKPTPDKFIKYNIDHPVARKAIGQFLDRFVPVVADHPNLMSLCLANEPVYAYSGKDKYSRPAFTAFLNARYQTIAKLNTLYGTNAATFDQVPVPEACGDDAPTQKRLAYYDWVRFNQHHFADWMQWMHDKVKSHASRPLTHIKQMADIYNRSTFHRGTDPEMISLITDLAGNDCWAYPSPGGTWCYNWQTEQIWYDLLHSFAGQAVFNSENHFIVDNSPAQSIDPNLTHAVMWQGMQHHVAASTLWVWEEAKGVDDLQGSIYYRPGNTMGAGLAMIRANQFADELVAINQNKAKVALLYSYPSIYWQPDHPSMVTNLYTALTLRGQPVTFISETQLATGQRSLANNQVQLLILPHSTHMTDKAYAGLKQFVANGGKVLAVGQDCGAYDDYGQLRSSQSQWLKIMPEHASEKIADQLDAILNQCDLQAPVLINVKTKQPVWGVEYRVVPQADRVLITLTNFNNSDMLVRLNLPGVDSEKAVDLLVSEAVTLEQIKLAPAQSKLIQVPVK